MAQKPSIPKGTRDFGQKEMAERNYIFDTIRSVFKTFGYAQIETPAMENLSTLLGKYGEEGDKLLFRILNSGDAFGSVDTAQVTGEDGRLDSRALSLKVCEKGLRYDLTVPFARYVVQHQNEISFPFKRFQMQPVWRADRPQKGRYREFYQCDVDAIGSKSQLCELELVQIVDKVFKLLDIRVLMKINNRKPITTQSYTEKMGVNQCVKAASNAMMNKLSVTVDETIIQSMIRYGKADIDSEYAEVLRQAISEYADGIFSLLRKYEYDPKLMRLYITGGGGKLVENFGTYEHDRVTIIEDICASAKGYEEFAIAQLRREGK